ncbi:MAG: recombination protein RmuC [Hyphomicrobiales bacterium]|jgi:DNA recombination protein RmuC|nr:recombination protein RmuC [Hyphomicrobiales bacterium]
MTETLLTLGTLHVTLGAALAAFAMIVVVLLIAIAMVVTRASRARGLEAERRDILSEELEERMGEIARIQAETAGRVLTMGEVLSGRQAELARAVSERLDSVTHRLGQSMQASTQHTMENLAKLNERLAVIDGAQKNITDLASQVTSLREVLANKQARGAFGQGRMEAIVQDGLPKDSYAFQFTLSNGKRPDCVVFLPGGERPLVIDAKFPLEAVSALRAARSDEERRHAATRLRQDVNKHVGDIAERYLIPGETQDLALMFVPSESVYAELYDGFDDLIQKAYRAQVVLVSPSLLMLAIQVMQQILKDSRMREAAHEIRTEVGHLMDDLGRLRDRVLNLQKHFGQANEDVTQILISADKVAKRGGRIESLEFEGDETAAEARVVIPAPIGRKRVAGE